MSIDTTYLLLKKVHGIKEGTYINQGCGEIFDRVPDKHKETAPDMKRYLYHIAVEICGDLQTSEPSRQQCIAYLTPPKLSFWKQLWKKLRKLFK